MMPVQTWILATFTLGAFCGPAAAQSQWTEFRGKDGTGYAAEADLPVAIDDSVVRWSTPISGKAWSSPVVWDEQIWLTNATEDGTRMSVLCVDHKSGEVVHDLLIHSDDDPAFCYPANSYASPTPAIEAGRLYVHFGAALTACIDTNSGEVLWRRTDFECDHHRGPASSPILHDGKLLIAFDGFDVQYVVALDAKSGKTLWKQNRDIEYGTDNGDRMKAYSTGTIINVAGKELFVSPSAMATIAYDPQTGKPEWTVYHDGMNASARPILLGDTLFITNGSGAMVAVRAGGSGDVTNTHIEWSSRQAVAKKATPLLVDDLLYMNSDDGVLSCREAATGEVLWLKRIGREYAASPIYASGRIYFFSVNGDIITLQPGREFKLLAETKLGDGFMASPAVAGDTLTLRSKSMLYCVGKPAN